jgi:hypothetical protein
MTVAKRKDKMKRKFDKKKGWNCMGLIDPAEDKDR